MKGCDEGVTPLDLAQQNAVGHEFDFRGRGYGFVEADLVADVTSDDISLRVISRVHSQLHSDAIGNRDRRYTTRLRDTNHPCVCVTSFLAYGKGPHLGFYFAGVRTPPHRETGGLGSFSLRMGVRKCHTKQI